MRSERALLVLLAVTDESTVVLLRPRPDLISHLAAPQRWFAAVGADFVAIDVASAALWLAACWLALGLAATVASRLPGLLGRGGRRLAAVVLPRAIYRLAAGAAGLGVLLSPAVARASSPHSSPSSVSSVAAARQLSAPAARPATDAVTPPSWPTDGALPAPTRPTSSPAPSSPARSSPAPSVATPAGATSVTVQPGDSLWRIAEAHLPHRPSAARIAAAWPRWYAANRRVIGDDPAELMPGQVLQAPRSQPASAHRAHQEN